MTMDINHRKAEIKADNFLTVKNHDDRGTTTTELQLPVKAKRSFDVAFLMLPDEKLKQRELAKLAKLSPPMMRSFEDLNTTVEHSPSPQVNSDDEDEEIEVDAPKLDLLKLQTQKFYTTQKQQIFGDPQLDKPKPPPTQDHQKSAFTKVSLKDTSRLSPNLSMSPDLNYQNSLSPSPPINRTYQNFQSSMLSPNSLFKNHVPAAYQTQFVQIPENFHQEGAPFILKSPNPELLQPAGFKMLRQGPVNMMPQYTTSSPYGYQFQPSPEMIKMAQQQQQHHHQQQQQQQQHEMRSNPAAAALLTSLLPPSLAALSLPAQNVCAKCNISFRMTSDLVYHMRSHHKNETTDYGKRKREDKLKCPVCAESFRERHHLTRHMTAHQDKDNDGEMPGNKTKKFTYAK